MRTPIFILILWLTAGLAGASVRPILHQGERYVRLEELAVFYGGELTPTPAADRVLIQTQWADLVLKPDSREVRIGGTLLWLHEPMIRVRGSWAIREGDALSVIDPIMRPGEYLRRTGYRVVVLDAGHGGPDSGAKGKRGVEEKRAALDIARRVRSHLVTAGIKVYMTRENDRFIELEERARMTRRWGADLFVSIHLNSASSTLAQGVETFVLVTEGFSSTAGGGKSTSAPGNQHNAANSALGFQIHRSLLQSTGAVDRGLKRARFIVIRNAPCPAVLVECGFLSHADEERKIMTEAYREEIARGIARGIINYVTLSRTAQRETVP